MANNCFSCEPCEHFIKPAPWVPGVCRFGLTNHQQGIKSCKKFRKKCDAYNIRPYDGSEKPGVHLRSASDNVNHPSHYETGRFECIDVMLETQGKEAVKNFCICNAFKYLYRHNNKNGTEDIKKAIWYLNKFVELESEQEAKERQGCDLCNGSEPGFTVKVKGTCLGTDLGVLYEHHFHPAFCPACGKKLKAECEYNETATKGE